MMGFRRSIRKNVENLRDVEESVERMEIWETEKEPEKKHEKTGKETWGAAASHPFQQTANNQCHNRPNETQDNIPMQKSLAK
jgi:hypothetical protein